MTSPHAGHAALPSLLHHQTLMFFSSWCPVIWSISPFLLKDTHCVLTHSSPWTLLPFICGKFLLLSASCTSFILVESIYLSVCYLCLINHLYICLPAYLSVHPSTCLSVYLPTYLCVYVCICVSSASSIFIYRLYIICLSYVYLSLFHLSR